MLPSSTFLAALVALKAAIDRNEVIMSFAVGPLPSVVVVTTALELLLTRGCASREDKPPLYVNTNGPPCGPVTVTVGLKVSVTGLVTVAVALALMRIEVEVDSDTADAVTVGFPVTVMEFAKVAVVSADVVFAKVVIVPKNVTPVTAASVLAEIVIELVLNVRVLEALSVALPLIVMDTPGTIAVTVASVGIPGPLTNIPAATPEVFVMAMTGEALVVVPDNVN